MGDAYIAVIPDCPTHGTMHRVQAKRALGNGWYVLRAATMWSMTKTWTGTPWGRLSLTGPGHRTAR